MTSDELEKEIVDAFQGVPYPGDDHLVSHACWECEELAGQLKGTPWQEWASRPPEDLYMRGGGICLLRADAFKYYLPAYLIASFGDQENYIQNQLIGILTNPRSNASAGVTESELAEREAWFRKRMEGFAPAQALIIKKYLRFILLEDITGLANPEFVKTALRDFEALYPAGKESAV
jgi:hypothetical protein